MAQLIQRCQLLRQQDDLPLRQDDHAKHEANPSRHGCERGIRDERLIEVRRPRLRSANGGRSSQVIIAPQGVEPELFGTLRYFEELLGADIRHRVCRTFATGRKSETKLHEASSMASSF